jgi:hypothetical protein
MSVTFANLKGVVPASAAESMAAYDSLYPGSEDQKRLHQKKE